jgi:ABC-type lipoprotein export system ATPase subunit
MTVIELHDLCKTYHIGEIDIPVLRGVSLNVERGEFVALMGASGSGKTTLLNIIGCLDHPSSGSYKLDGQEVSALSSNEQAALRNSKLGFVFQTFNLLRRTTALDNVLMPLAYSHVSVSREEAEQRATTLLKRVGLGDRLEHDATQLSGGQNQRVAIARALINHPAILLADEPTGNLDSQASAEILSMLETLNREDGITLVLVTHDAEVASRAQRIIHIRDGKIEQDGRKHNLSGKQPEERDRTEQGGR